MADNDGRSGGGCKDEGSGGQGQATTATEVVAPPALPRSSNATMRTSAVCTVVKGPTTPSNMSLPTEFIGVSVAVPPFGLQRTTTDSSGELSLIRAEIVVWMLEHSLAPETWTDGGEACGLWMMGLSS